MDAKKTEVGGQTSNLYEGGSEWINRYMYDRDAIQNPLLKTVWEWSENYGKRWNKAINDGVERCKELKQSLLEVNSAF